MSGKSRQEVEALWGNEIDLHCSHKFSGSARIASGKEEKYKILLVQI